MTYKYGERRDDLLKRLRRVEGQVRGIARMVEEDAYCVDVLTQIAAVNAALDKVGTSLLNDHIRGCVADAVASNGGQDKIDELVDVVGRFLKT
jgi:DNA-binding FrmR family transcriptional regulator